MGSSDEVTQEPNNSQDLKNDSQLKIIKLSENAIFQVLGFGISFLYLFGYMFDEGFLSGFGASLELFPKSADYYFISLFTLIAGYILTEPEVILWILFPLVIAL